MAVMTISEARAALPEVLNRVAAGEEVTITRHGRPVAVVVRPDVVWHQPPSASGDEDLVVTLREHATRHGRSLRQELLAILDSVDAAAAEEALPPIQLTTVRTGRTSTWSREEIYSDEGR